MAKDRKNTNQLVSDDDDATAEFEAIIVATRKQESVQEELESAANTVGLSRGAIVGTDTAIDLAAIRSDLEARGATIGRLEFEVARLQSRQLGLEAESASRDEVISQLRGQLENATSSLERKQGLLKKRDEQVKALRLEIRERNARFVSVQKQLETMSEHQVAEDDDHITSSGDQVAMRSRGLTHSGVAIHELRQRYDRIESYADELRRQLQNRDIESQAVRKARELSQCDLAKAADRIKAQDTTIADLKEQNAQLNDILEALKSSHAEEIRTIRFELGSAQETLSQHELLTEQLASDLVETRTYRVQLETMLSATEENSKARIEKLEHEIQKLRREAAESLQKLESKNEAINCLISELARKSHQVKATADKDNIDDTVDTTTYEPVDTHGPAERDKITRVLIGYIDGQEVRFPLFKDRLTIGRTELNDIQLKVAHVSRRHAVIVCEGGVTRVIDWGSKNGVLVNARRITEHFLKHGDVVSVGNSEFRYEERAKRDTRES